MKSRVNKVKLEPYYLAYIDILGISDAINSDKSEDYLLKIHNLYDDVFRAIKSLEISKYNIIPVVKNFSDNIVLAIKKDYPYTLNEEIKQFILVNFASFFQMLGFKYSFLTRGCITSSELYIDETFLYGKALTRAYEGENKIAIYPRIIIDNNCIKEYIQNNQIREYLKKDFDGICYLDSFQKYFDTVEFEDPDGLEILNQTLKEKLKENDNDKKVLQKKYWVLEKYNAFCVNNNLHDSLIDIHDFPYDPNYIRTVITGKAKELV